MTSKAATVLNAAWLDLESGGTRLRVSIPPDGRKLDDFWCRLDGGADGVFVRFTFLAFIRGERIFEASEWRQTDDPRQVSPGPLLQLVGPLREASSDPMIAGELAVRKACSERSQSKRLLALYREYRIASDEVRDAILLALMMRAATTKESAAPGARVA